MIKGLYSYWEISILTLPGLFSWSNQGETCWYFLQQKVFSPCLVKTCSELKVVDLKCFAMVTTRSIVVTKGAGGGEGLNYLMTESWPSNYQVFISKSWSVNSFHQNCLEMQNNNLQKAIFARHNSDRQFDPVKFRMRSVLDRNANIYFCQ